MGFLGSIDRRIIRYRGLSNYILKFIEIKWVKNMSKEYKSIEND